MKTLRIVNETRSRPLGDRVWLADRWWPRLRGLLGRGPLAEGGGLVIEPCKAVHMYGMKYSLDIAFVDDRGEVLAIYPELAPGARTAWHGPARRAVELPAGKLSQTGTVVGDRLTCEPSEGRAR